jgi:hypothetical protein
MNAKTKKEQIELAWEQHEYETYPFDHPLAGSFRGCCIDCDWGIEDPIMETLWEEEIDWFNSIEIYTDEWGFVRLDLAVAAPHVRHSRFYKKPEETEKDLNLPVASFQP